MRRCVGCYCSFPQDSLIRFTLDEDKLIPDQGCKNEGRGVYLCKNKECLEVAVKKKAFNRSFKKTVDVESNRKLIDSIIQ